jgi:hypothetical protein
MMISLGVDNIEDATLNRIDQIERSRRLDRLRRRYQSHESGSMVRDWSFSTPSRKRRPKPTRSADRSQLAAPTEANSSGQTSSTCCIGRKTVRSTQPTHDRKCDNPNSFGLGKCSKPIIHIDFHRNAQGDLYQCDTPNHPYGHTLYQFRPVAPTEANSTGQTNSARTNPARQERTRPGRNELGANELDPAGTNSVRRERTRPGRNELGSARTNSARQERTRRERTVAPIESVRVRWLRGLRFRASGRRDRGWKAHSSASR